MAAGAAGCGGGGTLSAQLAAHPAASSADPTATPSSPAPPSPSSSAHPSPAPTRPPGSRIIVGTGVSLVLPGFRVYAATDITEGISPLIPTTPALHAFAKLSPQVQHDTQLVAVHVPANGEDVTVTAPTTAVRLSGSDLTEYARGVRIGLQNADPGHPTSERAITLTGSVAAYEFETTGIKDAAGRVVDHTYVLVPDGMRAVLVEIGTTTGTSPSVAAAVVAGIRRID